MFYLEEETEAEPLVVLVVPPLQRILKQRAKTIRNIVISQGYLILQFCKEVPEEYVLKWKCDEIFWHYFIS